MAYTASGPIAFDCAGQLLAFIAPPMINPRTMRFCTKILSTGCGKAATIVAAAHRDQRDDSSDQSFSLHEPVSITLVMIAGSLAGDDILLTAYDLAN
jgi:hypothetical protein